MISRSYNVNNYVYSKSKSIELRTDLANFEIKLDGFMWILT